MPEISLPGNLLPLLLSPKPRPLLHLLLREPYCFVLQRNVQSNRAVVRLVYDYLAPEVARILHDNIGIIFRILFVFGRLVQ